MAKSDLGKKHLCPKCEKCFYDLKREPAVCPKCGTEMEPPKKPRTRRGSGPDHQKKQTAAASPNIISDTDNTEFNDKLDVPDDKTIEIDDDEPQQVESGDEQENVIGDTSDIGGVDDGISEVFVHVDKAVAD